MNFVFIQFIGAIAYALLTLSYFKKEKSKILFLQLFSYLMFSIHYYLLNGITGAICNLIGLFALTTIYYFEKYKPKNNKIIPIAFILILIVINIITFQNVFSIFPMIASTIVIVSFLMNNEDSIRAIGVLSAVCWLIYAVVYKSYISIAFEVVTLIGVYIAFMKNIKKGSKILKNKEKE